jgi:hypothetical protein
MNMDWKTARAIILAIMGISGLFLTGIVSAVSGFSLSTPILGFDTKILLGLANIFGAWLLWKKL